MTSNIFLIDHLVGFQSFLRMLTQISPEAEMLGWKILVRKYPLGGRWGNSSPRLRTQLKTPPSYGVTAMYYTELLLGPLIYDECVKGS